MTDRDYVDFCNFAHQLRHRAELYFGAYDIEHLRQMQGAVQEERAGGSVDPAYDFLAMVLNEQIAALENLPAAAQQKEGAGHGLPF